MINTRKKMMGRLVAVSLIVGLALTSAVCAITYDDLVVVKQTSNEIAEKARSIGLPETHDIIVNAKELWHGANNAIQNKEYEIPKAKYYDDSWIVLLAKTARAECNGMRSVTEIAGVMWSILNRYDIGQGTILNIVVNQYAYYSSAPTVTYYTADQFHDLNVIAFDVLERWNDEKNGIENVGRVLPFEYIYFNGSNGHNYFRNTYKHTGRYWDWSLPSPYES